MMIFIIYSINACKLSPFNKDKIHCTTIDGSNVCQIRLALCPSLSHMTFVRVSFSNNAYQQLINPHQVFFCC